MPVKLKLGKPIGRQTFGNSILRGVLVVALVGLVLFASVFGYFYFK